MGEMINHPAFSRDRLHNTILAQSGREGLWNRFAQFDRECGVVIPGAMEALRNEQWDSFGRYVEESQRMADVWLGNQVPETNDLAHLAREAGAFGASAFGAGFGGAVWALVQTDDAERFMGDWMTAYSQRHPSRMTGARFFTETPSQGVFVRGASGFSFS